MAKKNRDTKGAKEAPTFAEQIRRVALAGVGAIVMAQEEMADFVHRLVEHGELGEQDGKRVIHDIFSRKSAVSSVEAQVNARFSQLVKSMTLPSGRDFSSLSERLARLENELDSALVTSHQV